MDKSGTSQLTKISMAFGVPPERGPSITPAMVKQLAEEEQEDEGGGGDGEEDDGDGGDGGGDGNGGPIIIGGPP